MKLGTGFFLSLDVDEPVEGFFGVCGMGFPVTRRATKLGQDLT